ncbi:MAG: hypothetical protein Q7S89_02100 [bacterium]|nr:hypothetical protein [bacterium]
MAPETIITRRDNVKNQPIVKTESLRPNEAPSFVDRLMKSCGTAALAIASFVTVGIVVGDDPKVFVAYIKGLGAKLAEKLHMNITPPPGFVGVASIAHTNGVSIVEAPAAFFASPFANGIIAAVVNKLIAYLGTGGGTLMLNVPSGQEGTQAYVSTDGTTWYRVASGTRPVSCMRFVPGTRYAIAIGPESDGILMIDTSDKKLIAGKRTTDWKVMGNPFEGGQVAFLSRVKPDGTVVATSENGHKATLKLDTASVTYSVIGEIDTTSPNTAVIAGLDFEEDIGDAMRGQAGIAYALRNRATTAIALEYLPYTTPDDTSATAATS